MAFYYQPYPAYPTSDPWRTTFIPNHYPEHHYPLEHTRHSIGHRLSTVGHALAHPMETDPAVYCPRADIQESATTYYIDVELPGVKRKEDVKLKWLSTSTLLLETKVARPLSEEESVSGEEQANAVGVGAKPQGKSVYHVIQERHIGVFARAFNFMAKVDHATLSAELEQGLLRLKVPKLPSEEVHDDHKTPVVKGSA